MQAMANGTRVQYHDPAYGHGLIVKSRTEGGGDDTEHEYLIRWDQDPDGEGPTWCWWNEVNPA